MGTISVGWVRGLLLDPDLYKRLHANVVYISSNNLFFVNSGDSKSELKVLVGLDEGFCEGSSCLLQLLRPSMFPFVWSVCVHMHTWVYVYM